MLDQTPTAAMAQASSFSESEVLSFYLALSPADRTARFKVHADDGYVRRWRAAIDRQHYWAAALDRDGRLLGLVELFGSKRAGWKRPELAASFPAAAALSPRLAEALVDRGLEMARALGAWDVVMWLDDQNRFAGSVQKRWPTSIDLDLGTAVIRTR